MRPLLPESSSILPYLKQIDQNRWYTNFGPLVSDLAARLEDFFGLGKGCVVTTSNGTAALTNVLRAMNLPANSFCLLPSWTFIAVPAAVKAAGLRPYFLDVNEPDMALTPQLVKQLLPTVAGKVGAVIYVSPFGAVPNTGEWEKFSEENGIPVVVDGASCFDSIARNPHVISYKIPTIMSLHATKAFGAGEGGIVLCKNSEFIERVQEISNFGFNIPRVISIAGTNGKMSEYTAAVAHAELDRWDAKRAMWSDTFDYYINTLEQAGIEHLLSRERITSTCNIRLPKVRAGEMVIKLQEHGVEAKKWWGDGCHRQLAYSQCERTALPITEKLADRILGLPLSVDLAKEDIRYVVQTLSELLKNETAKTLQKADQQSLT